jgi:hypothetical protein
MTDRQGTGSFCPYCGKQLLLSNQKFCAYCAGDLSILAQGAWPMPSSEAAPPAASATPLLDTAGIGRATTAGPAVVPRTPAPLLAASASPPWGVAQGPSADLAGSGDATSPYSGAAPLAKSLRALLEAGAAGLAAIAFVLPFLTVSETSSYLSSTASASVSTLDYIQRTNWTQWIELDLIVFGTVAALAIALARAFKPVRWGPRATLCGFLVLVAGYVWLLLEWNTQVSQMTSLFSGYGLLVGITQGVGLWLGLGSGVVGALICLVDLGEKD